MRRPHPINIKLIDHIVIRTRSLPEMVDFYCDVLGCRLERGPGDLGLVQLRAGDSLIDLADMNAPIGREGGAAPDHAAPNLDHVCLQLSPWDSDEIIAHLKSHHVAVDEVATRYGAQGFGPSIYIVDPEGNRVELKGEEKNQQGSR